MITLGPRYARDYVNSQSVVDDWNANKDFTILSIGHPYRGAAINKQDAKEDVRIRYKGLTRSVGIKYKP